jgi:hypothetical protein
MAKQKFKGMITLNTLETMVEYTLILGIFDRICEMTTKSLEYLRDSTLLNPLKNLLQIRTWGIEWKRQIDKTIEWVAWQWVNVKIDKESIALLKKIVNILKEYMEDYHLAMITHVMDFFQERASLKKLILEHFFTSLLQVLTTKELVSLGNLLSIEFMKPSQ